MSFQQVTHASSGRYEAELGVCFLPRCSACNAPHPLAVKYARDKTRCSNPACDEPARDPSDEVVVPAVVNGITTQVGFLLMAIGRFFGWLAGKV
jgi:hypothetical protein